MKRLILIILVASLLLAPLFMQTGRIGRVNASPSTVFADTTDGYLDSNGVIYSTFAQMSLGDWSNDAYSHCYVKFSLSGVSGTLSSATLNLYVYISYHNNNSYATSPLTNPGLGDCQVVHIADYGILDTSDFTAASIGNDPGILLNGTVAPNVGYVSIDVRAAMQDDINHGRPWSAIMLRMSTNTDGNNDNDYWVFYTSKDVNTSHHPYVAYDLVHQGDLILTGNNVTTIEGAFDINGSIIVKDNASLILRNAILNFTQTSNWQFEMTFQHPAQGNPRLVVENSTIAANNFNMYMNFYGNTSVEVNGSVLAYGALAYLYEDSNMSVMNSNIDRLVTFGSSTVESLNSTYSWIDTYGNKNGSFNNCVTDTLITRLDAVLTLTNCTVSSVAFFEPSDANYSVTNHKPCFLTNWNFLQNCTVATAPIGVAPNVTLIGTQVNGWGFSSKGNSNYTVSDSVLYALDAHDYSNVYVYNSTVSWRLWSSESSNLWFLNSTSNTYAIEDNSSVHVSWYLDIHVVDSIGQDIPSATVSAYYSNSTMAASSSTNGTGWTRQVLTERIRNATGDYPVGNYTVTAIYTTYSNLTTVNMTQNQQATLELSGLIIPELSSFLILPLLMIATLLAVTVYRRKHSK